MTARECTAECLLVAVPSLWPEPFGLIGLDAASLGRPAVAFDVGGIGEWLTDGLNGRLVEPGAGEEGLARAIVSLLGEPAERERMGQHALEVSRRMSVAAHVERLEGVLLDAASAQPVRNPVVIMKHWTILTCEYPPGCGGVGDYTAQVAAALAAVGDTVTVFCPPRPADVFSDSGPSVVGHAGVEVVVLDDVYGRLGRRAIDERLNRAPSAIPSTILVQYVPTGFGLRGANIPWCRWLLERSRRPGTDVRVMFHEPYFEFTWSPVLQNALAIAERLMAKVLLRAASRVYVSTDAWRRYLAPHMPAGRPPEFVTLPIPSAIPRSHRESEIADRRAELLGSSSTRLVGHFGTFGSEVAPMLATALTRLLNDGSKISAVCVGSGSDEFVRSLSGTTPAIGEWLHGTGRVSAPEAALTLSACDLLLQPFPDGVTTRRTSVMAGLINARAIVTTNGHLTEPLWADTGAVALAAAPDTDAFVAAARHLLSEDDDRAALAARGEKTYRERFALSHTVRALRGAVEGAAA